MNQSQGAFVLFALMAAGAPAPAAVEATTSSIERLAWLAGCWEQKKGDRVVQEQWMSPMGTTMLGMSRTVAKGRTVGYEQMRIEERDGKLVFTSKPSGQAESSFTHIELGDSVVVFSDPQHDFPQRIIYRRLEDGSLMARIEGEEAGKVHGVDFPMTRGSCPAAVTGR